MSTRAEPTEVPDHDGLDIRSALDDPTAAAGQLAAILLAEATSTFRGRVPIDGIAQLVTAGCYTRSLSRPPRWPLPSAGTTRNADAGSNHSLRPSSGPGAALMLSKPHTLFEQIQPRQDMSRRTHAPSRRSFVQ